MNRSEVTYHRDIFIPTNITVPQRVVAVEYSAHAIAEGQADRYGRIPKVTSIDLSSELVQIIEVTKNTETGKLSKILVRFPHPTRAEDDVILVLRQRSGAWLAVTTWVNKRDDKHRTLDRSKYGTR